MTYDNLDYSHMDNPIYKDNVYMPSDDTFFFVDTLREEILRILASEPLSVLEIGSGSGYISTFLMKLIKSHLSSGSNTHSVLGSEGIRSQILNATKPMPFFVAIDINGYATESTLDMFELNRVSNYSDAIRIDLLGGGVLNHFFDLILFNPPYVPCESGLNASQDLIDRAWNGGIDGAEVIISFIEVISKYLSMKGVVYLLLEKRNKMDVIMRLVEDHDFTADLVGTRKIVGETLSMIRLYKKTRYNTHI